MTKNGEHYFVEPSDERWMSFVGSKPQATIFHHPQWIKLLYECYGYRPFIMAVNDSDGNICAGLPLMEIKSPITGRRWVSLPFTDHCSPLYSDPASLDRLVEGLSCLFQTKRIPEIELRWDMPHCRISQPSAKFMLHNIRLSPDFESVAARFHNMHKRNISVAEKKGVRIEWGSKQEHLDAFYQLHLQTRHRQGVPIQPKRFFDLLGKELIDQGLGYVLLAYKDNQCLAAAVFLHWQKTLTYKFGASDTKWRSLQPNHLLLQTAIRWGCENGFTLFDMGRTDLGHDGLCKFKSGWGAEETSLTYSTISRRTPRHLVAGDTMKIVKPVIQKSPRWVCRLAGELLYKHFG
jgi:hypothetical protein